MEKCRRVFESILSNRKLLEPNQKFADVYRQLHELSPSKVQSAQFSELWEDLILGCRPMYEFVAKAIASLQERTESVDLRDIYKEVERLRKEFGIGSRDTSFQPNVRSSLSAHTKGRGARDLFYHNIRSSQRSGKWRLSKEGRDLVRGLTE